MKKLITFITASYFLTALIAQTFPVEKIVHTPASSANKTIKRQKALTNYKKSGSLVWGAGSSNGAALGEFSTPFTTQDTSTTNWIVKSVYESGGAVTPGSAFWVRNLTGYSAGAYWQGTTPHGSSSQANGSALFDSDFLDNNGIPGAFGTGASPSVHKGELISPPIDLTGYTNQALIVKFFTFYRSFQISNLGVSLSVDGGITYSHANILNNSINFTEQTVSILFPTITTGVSNLTNCRLKFTFEGDYYFAFIDDVSIETAEAIDLTIEEADNSGNTVAADFKDLQVINNRHFSVNQLVDHHFRYGANVKNKGYGKVIQSDNAMLNVKIQRNNLGNWLTVYQDSTSIDTLNTVGLGRPFIDTIKVKNWATIGAYRVIYTTSCNSDNNPSNDTLMQYFSLNDDQYFSKVDVTNGLPSFDRQIFPGGGPFKKFEFGSMFSFPNGQASNLALDSVSLIYYTPNNYTGANSIILKVNLYEFNDGINGATKNGFIDNSGLKNELKLIATGSKTLTNLNLGAYAGTSIQLTDTSTNTTKPLLIDNKYYFVSLELDAGLNSITDFNSTNMIWFGASTAKSYSMNYSGIDSNNVIPLPSTIFLTDASSISSSNSIGFGMDIIPSFGIFTTNVCQTFNGQIASSTNVSCNGGVDGTATANASGGLAPYSYLWSSNNTSSSITNTSAGKLYVTITDMNNCTAIDSVTITEPIAITTTIDTTVCGSYTWPQNSITYNISGMYNDTIQRTAGCDSIVILDLTINSIPTTPTSINPIAVCSGTDTLLVANGSTSSYRWYDAAFPNTAIHTGDTLLLPNMNSTKTYEVEGFNFSTEVFGPTTTPSSGYIDNTLGRGTIFDVNIPEVIIDSVTIYPTGTGWIVIQVINHTGTVTYNTSDTIRVTGSNLTKTRVPLNFSIPFGINQYKMALTYSSGITSMGRNVQAFPFNSSGNEVSIISGTFDVTATRSTNNYWFYDWGISVPSCPSNRTSTTVTVNQATSSTVVKNECGSYTWPQNNVTYTSSGVYNDTVPNSNGCDSVITLNLTINTATVSALNVRNCGPYTWAQNNLNYTTSGAYNDTIQNAAGCDSVITLNLTINSIPTADAGTNMAICNGQAVVIGGTPTGPVGSTYLWSNAVSLNSATVSNPTASPTMNTTYTVTVTNSNNCSSTDQVSVTVNQTTASTVSQTACSSFTWSQNSITYTASGTYNDTIPNANNCDSVVTLNLTIDSSIYTVTQNNGVLTADQTGATYRWLDCNNAYAPIIGATSQSYTATANGSYAVEITKGSCIDTSSCIPIVINSIKEKYSNSSRFEIYPNPSDGNIVLIHSMVNNNNQIAQVFDIKGQLVYETKLINEQSNHNLHFLENGMYFIKVGTDMKKFIVSK